MQTKSHAAMAAAPLSSCRCIIWHHTSDSLERRLDCSLTT
jgi:hypothetical protein